MAQTAEPAVTPVRGATLWPISIEAYHVLGEAGVIPKNTELLYGLVYTRMPISPFHAYLLSILLEITRNAAGSLYVRSEMPLTCADSEPQPDISVVKGSPHEYRKNHPRSAELVIEVCVTSHDYDRSKMRAYALAGVKECWLTLGPEKEIEIYREPLNGQYSKKEVYTLGQTAESRSVPSFSVNLSKLFAE